MATHGTIAVYQRTDVLLRFRPARSVDDPDITGWSIRLTVRDADGNLVFQEDADLADEEEGIFEVLLTRSQTNEDAADDHVHDVRRIDTGAERVLHEGPFQIKPGVRA